MEEGKEELEGGREEGREVGRREGVSEEGGGGTEGSR